ncbi:MAG: type II secretion system secretin GspD [Methylococcaceae bacterium]|nr:type II secretion system secretin GspD [Methylococcaceae bacterium]
MKSYKKLTSLFGLIIVSSILLTACDPLTAKLGPRLGMKIPIEARSEKDYVKPENDGEKEEEPKFSQLENSDSSKTDKTEIKAQKIIGNGRFISPPNDVVSSKLGKGGKYSLNFDAADLGEVTKIILTDMLQENYVMSPKVGGTVTLQTTDPLHKEELLPTLEMLLRINGAVLIKRGGSYRIEADGDSVQVANASSLNGKKIRAGYQIKVVPLKYVGAADMAEVITPIVPNKAIVKVDTARNILLVAGTHDELKKILGLIKTFDVNFIAGMSFGLFPLENTEVTNTVAEVEQIFNEGEKNPLSGMIRFVSIKHLNAILVITKQRAYLKEAENWISRLDKANAGVGEGGVIVYKVQHVDAVELASTLSQVVSGIATSSNKPASVAPGQKLGSLSNKSRDKSRKKENSRFSRNSRNTRNSRGSGQGISALENVSIIADESNNALVITAQPQQYRMLKKIIKQLDVMPLQVLIDAMIVSVTLEDDLQYGVQWRFKNGFGSGNDGVGNSSVKPLDLFTTAATDFVAQGFSYGLVGSDMGVKVALNAFAKDNKINVLSTPSVMVLNNHEANILVGNSIPIRKGEFTNTSGGANNSIANSSIDMVETGVSLNVKPRVNANGVVILEIEQKVNNALPAGNAASGSTIDSPTILKREITSSVAVVDGESVILGGLISEEHTFDNSGIPFVKDIPYLGWLFGSQQKKVAKNELVVIITPRVVVNKYDARKVTDEFKRKLSGIFYDEDGHKAEWNEINRNYSGQEIGEGKGGVRNLNENYNRPAKERREKRPKTIYP